MKTIFAVLLLVSSAFGAIKNSQLETRHQAQIEQAVMNQCGLRTPLTQTSQQITAIPVDQGVVDYEFVTTLTTFVQIDQGQGDDVEITVTTRYSDVYDHSAGQWGVYSVKEVRSQGFYCGTR